MEHLRWVLLAAGIIFVIIVYMLGRNRRERGRDRYDSHEQYNEDIDSPEFGSRELDEIEDVSDVHVVAKETDDWNDRGSLIDDELEQEAEADVFLEEIIEEKEKKDKDDIIVLHILANSNQMIRGDQVNSAARSNGLVFGEMNIFHRLDDDEKSVYGLANMLEPGSFDPENIHTMTMPGLTFFMEPAKLENPSDAFDDMLQCAYQISEVLGAQLCNQRRQPLTEHEAEQYREVVACYDGE